MPLTLRSLLLPLSLSGALALVGLWWYVTRKKAGLADHDSQEGKTSADLSPAPDEGTGQKVEKGSGEEQGVEGGTNGPDVDTADATRTSEAASGGGSEAAAPQPGATDRCEPSPAEASPRKDPPPSGEGDRASAPARLPDVAEEKRPDPEGEVGGGDAEECKAAVRLAVLQLRSDPSDDRALSGEIVRPAPPEAAEPVRPPPAGAKEMQQLAEGMISHMVSAAVAEVLQATAAGKTLPEQAGGPSRARELCAAVPDGGPADDGETQGRKPEDGGPTTDGEGGASPAAGEGCGGGLAEEEEDSTSSSQAGDSSSDEDYRVPSRSGAEAPEEPEDPDKSVTTTRGRPEVLRNGHGKEEEPLTQDHGMTGMTRYCEQGAADGQVSSLQSSLSSLPPPETTEPHTIWEFEVPKHLVGRMIGKQGRYVSYLEATSGATVFISAVPYTQEIQVCHIEGTEGQVEAALDLIRMKFKDLELTNCYAQPPVLSLPSLPITSWLLLPHRVTVEVQVVQVASGNYLFVQQHTHPTFHALRVLDQQMSLCYSHPGCPSLPAPVEVGVICAAQVPEGAWWRAQVMRFNEESREVEIRYVDYGGYHTVNIDSLRQIRSDFVSLPFQGSEVILENLAPLSGEEHFSDAAKSALEDLTQGVSLLAQVTEFHTSGIPLVQIWKKEENQLVSVNQALVERGVCSWINRP